MGLNIENERVHELAREADRAARAERMLAMGARSRREERTPSRGIVNVEEMYDEQTGLPL
jgi:antitoxin VapB